MSRSPRSIFSHAGFGAILEPPASLRHVLSARDGRLGGPPVASVRPIGKAQPDRPPGGRFWEGRGSSDGLIGGDIERMRAARMYDRSLNQAAHRVDGENDGSLDFAAPGRPRRILRKMYARHHHSIDDRKIGRFRLAAGDW